MIETRIIAELVIDNDSLPPSSPEMVHERRVAIFDILEENEFALIDGPEGPYRVDLGMIEKRLKLGVSHIDGAPIKDVMVSMTAFRRVIKDYFMICESYHNAIRTAMPAQIEAIDMGRRGLHNEGSRMLSDALRQHAEIDFQTSRRLFTLICALHRRPKRDVMS
ncbi:UPF0262 family protein [Robiginitomaculum antarcticum]|uniref:UPF0262 family protein n=1 Tax=Robiginitomaculum antarcticum TaxID=437507 RepID=UPI00035F4E5E|nr:UPF0262 family protein [Robiginitomaculum antarcticum]